MDIIKTYECFFRFSIPNSEISFLKNNELNELNEVLDIERIGIDISDYEIFETLKSENFINEPINVSIIKGGRKKILFSKNPKLQEKFLNLTDVSMGVCIKKYKKEKKNNQSSEEYFLQIENTELSSIGSKPIETPPYLYNFISKGDALRIQGSRANLYLSETYKPTKIEILSISIPKEKEVETKKRDSTEITGTWPDNP
jgi:hypothetical protein